MGRVLIFGSDTRSFLSVVRSLGRGGHEVHIACTPDAQEARYGITQDLLARRAALSSRYVHQVHDIPQYDPDPQAWVAAVRSILASAAFDLVIPTNDDFAVPLQVHVHQLSDLARIYTLSDEAYDVVFDKLKTAALARQLGVNVPAEVVVEQPAQIASLHSRFELPVVLKPQSSVRAEAVSVRHGVKKLSSWEEVDHALETMLKVGPVAVQENCSGVGVGVELLMYEGRPLLSFQHQRVHEPLRGGGSSYRMGVPLSPHLLDASVKLLSAVKYTGVAMVEFKVDLDTGHWVLIEINGRFWGSLPLALASGCDFPLGLYQMLVEGRREFPNTCRVGLNSRSWYTDFGWFMTNLRADRSDPTISAVPVKRVFTEAIRNVATLRERSDTLVPDDLSPAVREFSLLTSSMLDEVRNFLRSRIYRQPAARRLIRARALRALRRASSVLFVCKGNVCRSPFAEVYCRQARPGLRVRSAGYLGPANRQTPDDGVSAAAAMGVDLAGHRSYLITAEEIVQFDVILVFDLQNLSTITSKFPEVRNRTFLVGLLKPEDPVQVADPWGKPEAFTTCYSQIAELVRQIPPTGSTAATQQADATPQG